MGNSKSKTVTLSSGGPQNFFTIKDNYQTLDEVQDALRKAGLESSNRYVLIFILFTNLVIVGIDFTGSNEERGAKSFGGKCLHYIEPGHKNPYQEVIEIVGIQY
jgi:E3 ubiquitin-protein ligase RGLG